MFDLFYQYLVLHKKVTVPGLGTFMIVRKTAQLSFEHKTLTSPGWEVIFAKGDLPADKDFYTYISQQQNTDDTGSVKNVSDFIFFIKREMSVYKKLDWPKIGTLTENVQGEFLLKSANQLFSYFPDVLAERIVRENGDKSVFDDNQPKSLTGVSKGSEETFPDVVKKQEWWIDAIILALLAIAAIGYYYLQNGTLR